MGRRNFCKMSSEMRAESSKRSKDLWAWQNLPTYLVPQLFEHEGHWAAVKVSRRCRHGGVNVCMGINPDKTQVGTLLGVASHRPNAQALGRNWGRDVRIRYSLKDLALLWRHVATCDRPPAWPACGRLQSLCLWHRPASYWRHQRCGESSRPWMGRPSRCGGSWGHQSRG